MNKNILIPLFTSSFNTSHKFGWGAECLFLLSRSGPVLVCVYLPLDKNALRSNEVSPFQRVTFFQELNWNVLVSQVMFGLPPSPRRRQRVGKELCGGSGLGVSPRSSTTSLAEAVQSLPQVCVAPPPTCETRPSSSTTFFELGFSLMFY